MAIDKTKVLGGPFNITFQDASAVDLLTVTGIKNKDNISFVAEPVVEELEDGSDDLYGYNVTMEMTYSEVDTGVLNAVKNAAKAIITFTAKGKTVSNATDFLTVYPGVDGWKTKITCKTYVAGSDWTNILTIA